MNNQNMLFPFTLGLSDGIITTLMLVSRSIIFGDAISFNLALRVASGSAFVGGFSYFIAEYSRLRDEISRTSKQLVLRSPTYLIRSKIGRDILVESIVGTGVSVTSGFAGSMIPLAFSVLIPQDGRISIFVAVAALAALGLGISKSVKGNYLFWMLTMVILGATVTGIGFYLHLV